MHTPSTAAAFVAFVTAALATTGPCSISEPDYICEPVMDASACYNAIILGWDGASTNPADIFKCVDPPELVGCLFLIVYDCGLEDSFPSRCRSGSRYGIYSEEQENAGAALRCCCYYLPGIVERNE
ncbi:hypothetical protein NPX13_g2438 [Xylaria arbuscula]|uniref:Hydrophobin n=1 Tax=Xylaria arbuscula TaxID=114810 RepID=A0A9W8NJL9_9PEZI|nr:hypothetical protein NPX13_g2438 [Xylaria arbuscula]